MKQKGNELIQQFNQKELKQLISYINQNLKNDDYYIYIIRNKITDEYYIGSSLNIEKRFHCHLHPSMTMLSKNKWELHELFLDSDYELMDSIELHNVTKQDVLFEETNTILNYIEQGHKILNKNFPMNLDKFGNY